MPVKSGQAVTVEFTTANPTTGAAADATGTPTGTLYVNGTANAATVTVTNQATGVYKAAVTLPTLAAGDVVAIRISATVASITGEGIVWQDTADTVYVSDILATWTPTKAMYLDAAISTRHASGAAVAKSPATLAAADVSGNLPADAKAWNGGALPTVGTSTLSTADLDARGVTTTNKAQTGDSYAYLGTNLGALGANATEAGGTGDHLTAIPKTGYKLASDGLDLITATEPAGRPTTFPGWIMWLVQRFRRATKSATAIMVKTEAGATVTTQAITSNGDDETLGPPT